MTVKHLSGRRIQGQSGDFAPTPAVAGGWVEVGRTTLGSAGDTIEVGSIPDKRYYKVLWNGNPSGNLDDIHLTLGNSTIDTGSNYARRLCNNGGSEEPVINQSSIDIDRNNGAYDRFGVMYIANLSGKEKLVISNRVHGYTAGASTAPLRCESIGKWTNTSNALDILRLTNVGTGDFAIGSEVVVLGWDTADTHTTNFWEELASVDLSGGASTSLSTGTFTAKKYLWVQIFSKKASAGGIQPSLKVGTGGTIATGSPYAFRWSNDGAADPTPSGNLAMCPIAWLGANVHFSNTFIINNSANEKLFINHSVANVTAGAGTAPQRVESVGKFANTSGQINIIDLYDWDSASLGTETIMKVWGSN
mgnify:CR=1 FL=1